MRRGGGLVRGEVVEMLRVNKNLFTEGGNSGNLF